jgi:hypothetical protein
LEDTKSKRVLQIMKEKIPNKWLSPDAWSSLIPPFHHHPIHPSSITQTHVPISLSPWVYGRLWPIAVIFSYFLGFFTLLLNWVVLWIWICLAIIPSCYPSSFHLVNVAKRVWSIAI